MRLGETAGAQAPCAEHLRVGASSVNQGMTYFPNGDVKTDPQGIYTYDARGQVATRQVAGGTYTYQYDVMGRSYVLTYPDGHTRTQLYDGEGRLTSRCYAYSNGPEPLLRRDIRRRWE